MANVIIMNTTLFDKTVPLPGNRTVPVKSNSSVNLDLTAREVKFLEAVKMNGIRISVGQLVDTEDVTSHAPTDNNKVADPVEDSKPVDVEALVKSLSVDILKELVAKLGIKTSATSVNTLANKVLDAADDATILALLDEVKVK